MKIKKDWLKSKLTTIKKGIISMVHKLKKEFAIITHQQSRVYPKEQYTQNTLHGAENCMYIAHYANLSVYGDYSILRKDAKKPFDIDVAKELWDKTMEEYGILSNHSEFSVMKNKIDRYGMLDVKHTKLQCAFMCLYLNPMCIEGVELANSLGIYADDNDSYLDALDGAIHPLESRILALAKEFKTNEEGKKDPKLIQYVENKQILSKNGYLGSEDCTLVDFAAASRLFKIETDQIKKINEQYNR